MKFPFDFSLVFIFRLIFPGFVLAPAMLPAVHLLLGTIGVDAPLEFAFPIEVIFWGWLIVLSDQPIYMLYEGRRYWPGWFRAAGLALERDRLKRLQNRVRNGDAEADLQVLWFPLDKKGHAEARYPTRLGNLLTAYETYPKRAYGQDSIFYWYRLWLAANKDLRDELDQSQAIADSGLYTSFALFAGALVCAAYLLSGWRCLPISYCREIPYLPDPPILLSLMAGAILLGYFIYRMALHPQAQYGELFRAFFDMHHADATFVDEVATEMATLGGDDKPSMREKYTIASRFLRWNQVRPKGRSTKITALGGDGRALSREGGSGRAA